VRKIRTFDYAAAADMAVNQDKHARELACHFGVCTGTIYHAIEKHLGMTLSAARKALGKKRVGQLIGKVDPARALEMHNQGMNLRQICAAFPGASRMAACRAIRRAKQAPAAQA
jgi:hypothetical protein